MAVIALLLLGAATLGPSAGARVSERSDYTKGQTYHTALRFLRVDRGFEIVERDLEAGYMIFAYPAAGSGDISNGSVEVIELEEGVRLVVSLPKMPEYHERLLSDGIFKKLQREYGDPPRKKAPKETDEPPDSGTEDKPKQKPAPKAHS